MQNVEERLFNLQLLSLPPVPVDDVDEWFTAQSSVTSDTTSTSSISLSKRQRRNLRKQKQFGTITPQKAVESVVRPSLTAVVQTPVAPVLAMSSKTEDPQASKVKNYTLCSKAVQNPVTLPEQANTITMQPQTFVVQTGDNATLPKPRVALIKKTATVVNVDDAKTTPQSNNSAVELSTTEDVSGIMGPAHNDSCAGSVCGTGTSEDGTDCEDDDDLITRMPKWYNRLIFDKSRSKFRMNQHQNLETGRLIARKQQHASDKLTVPSRFIDNDLYSYLRMQKFPKYENRQMALDHMHKLSCKYWTDIRKIPYSKLDGRQVNINLATVQKATDERANEFLLATEDQEIDRRKRLVKIYNFLEKKTPFFRRNHADPQPF